MCFNFKDFVPRLYAKVVNMSSSRTLVVKLLDGVCNYLVGERVLDEVHLRVDGVGEGGGEGRDPQRRDDLGRAPEPGHGVRVQRVANGQVPE